MFCQAREFLSLIGLLNSAADKVPHGRLYLRPLQLILLSRWRPHRDPLDREVPLPESFTLLREVWKFWDSEIHLNQGVFLHPPPPNLSMFTDVSNFGWGSPCERGRFIHKGHVVSGGVLDVYQHLGTQGSPARWKTLESVSVFGQFHGSGLHSKTGRYPHPSSLQNDMGTSPVLPSQEHSPRPTAYTGEVQLLADALSRSNMLVSTEWTLHMDIVQASCSRSVGLSDD
jgi:hypothetical protein